jgi:hypothetical protein
MYSNHHHIRVRERCEHDVGFGEGCLDTQPLGSHDWTLDRYMVNFTIMLSLLSLVLKGQVGAFSGVVYGSEGWETG